VTRPIGDFADFIRANTGMMAPPLVPEIRLHLAHEAVPVWQKTEEELGEIGLPPPFGLRLGRRSGAGPLCSTMRNSSVDGALSTWPRARAWSPSRRSRRVPRPCWRRISTASRWRQ
jgi:hypothetical protein